jgi:hypothetical protein
LGIRAQATGRRGFGAAWAPPELELVDRHARALTQNRFRTARQAAAACLEELNQRRLERLEVYAPRLLGRVSLVLSARARELGWVPEETRLAPEENRILDRYARRFLAGEFPTVQAAADKCMRELAVVYRSRPTLRAKTFATVWSYLSRRVHRQGAPSLLKRASPTEEATVNRYLEALLRGRYVKVTDAAADCFRELQRLWQRQPEPTWGSLQRNRHAVYNRLSARARTAGWVAYQSAWTPQELRVLERHARALARGLYMNSLQATADCRRELAQLHLAKPQVYGPRTALAVLTMLRPLALKLGWSGARSQLHPAEERLLNSFVDGLVLGRYPKAQDAVRACCEELKQLRRRLPALRPKKRATISTYLMRRLHERGIRLAAPRWQPKDEQVADVYAKALAEGKYRDAVAAAMAFLGQQVRNKRGAEAMALTRATARIRMLAQRFCIPHPQGRWSAAEKGILEHHARAVVTGRYAGPTPALGPCFAALNRHYGRLKTKSSHSLRAVGGRTQGAVFRKLDLFVRKLGWHGRPTPRWREEENRTCRRWVRWYGNHRRGRRGPITQAAEGLYEELEQIGASRSVSGCKAKLRKEWERPARVGMTRWSSWSSG